MKLANFTRLLCGVGRHNTKIVLTITFWTRWSKPLFPKKTAKLIDGNGERKRQLAFFTALSIQQKFRFEISEIPRAQWKSTFRLPRPDPSYGAFGYCSCKRDTNERYWGQQFCQMERDISVRPTEISGPVKVDHIQSWYRILRSD